MDRMKMIGLAFTHRSGNYQTVGDFPILLENVLGKVLLGAYATQPNTWERFCKVDEVPDFRTSNRYRTGSLPGLDVIPEHGEYKNAAIPDGAKYPLLTKRLGKIFGISRETILNDDMSALTDMATKMGQAAMRTIETSVFTLITANAGLGPTQSDAQPFFHANRANVNATGSAISITGIDADRVVMRSTEGSERSGLPRPQPGDPARPGRAARPAQQLNDAQYDPALEQVPGAELGPRALPRGHRHAAADRYAPLPDRRSDGLDRRRLPRGLRPWARDGEPGRLALRRRRSGRSPSTRTRRWAIPRPPSPTPACNRTPISASS
jgi:hypothetical protein